MYKILTKIGQTVDLWSKIEVWKDSNVVCNVWPISNSSNLTSNKLIVFTLSIKKIKKKYIYTYYSI